MSGFNVVLEKPDSASPEQLEKLKQGIAEKLSISEEAVAIVLSKTPYVLKNSLPLEEARQMANDLRITGAIISIVSENDGSIIEEETAEGASIKFDETNKLDNDGGDTPELSQNYNTEIKTTPSGLTFDQSISDKLTETEEEEKEEVVEVIEQQAPPPIIEEPESKPEIKEKTPTAPLPTMQAAHSTKVEKKADEEFVVIKKKSLSKTFFINLITILVIVLIFFIPKFVKKADFSTIDVSFLDALLQDQMKIFSGDQSNKDKEAKEIKIVQEWQGKTKDKIYTSNVVAMTVNEAIKKINLRIVTDKPAKLTPKEIVDGVPHPIWLERVTVDLILEEPIEKTLKIKVGAYLKQKNRTNRVLADLILNYQVRENNVLTGSWLLTHGDWEKNKEYHSLRDKEGRISLYHRGFLKASLLDDKKPLTQDENPNNTDSDVEVDKENLEQTE